MRIYILRHGETEWNKLKRLQGSTDIPLDETGRELARKTGRAVAGAGIRFDACVSSPLGRAAETAKLVLEGQGDGGKVPFDTDPRIAEFSMGAWEGDCLYDTPGLPKADPGFHLFFDAPDRFQGPEDAETFPDVIARTGAFLRDMAERYRDREGRDFNLLVSTHGCASRALLMNIDPVPMKDYWRGCVPPNCSVSIASLRRGKWQLEQQDVRFAE